MNTVAQENPAALIIRNGPIYTADAAHPTAEAVAVRDGRIVLVGSDAEAMRLKGPGTEVLDLRGATLVPGLEDAHGHVLGLGTSLATLDLRDTPSSARIAELVAERAKTIPPGQWILGSGWDQNDWPDKAWPTRDLLDRAAPHHPVLLGRIDGHATWANSRALQAAGIDAKTADPEGGRLIRDASNLPTGILVDTAQALVRRHVTELDDAALEARIVAADRAMSSVGLTMVHDAGVASRTIALYRQPVQAGFQPATHAIGDAANRRVLDIYETVEKELPAARGLRPRIEHAQILDAVDIPRFASLGVIASMQPTHCTSDMPWASARIGLRKARTSGRSCCGRARDSPPARTSLWNVPIRFSASTPRSRGRR